MKVTNWRRKLGESLVACGLLSPAVALAADLNVNLIANPSFEDVTPGQTGPFSSVRINQWTDSGLDGNATDDTFAYAFTQNYAGVNTPAGAGSRYFTGGFNTTAGQATIGQTIDLSTGATGATIPAGEGAFVLSGFFSSYLTQADASRLRVRFLNSSAVEVGRSEVGGAAFVASQPTQTGAFGAHRNWAKDLTSGLIPASARSAAVEIISDIGVGNHDGYTDLVELQVVNAADFLMFLEVNTATGQTTIKNQTGETLHVDYYEITSAGNSLSVASWNSLQDQNLPGFPRGNGTGNGWEEAGGADAGVLSESYLTSNSALAHQSSVNLGAAYSAGVNARDLVFRYGVVPPSTTTPAADFDADSDVDGGDFLVWQRNFGRTGATQAQGDANADGNVNAADFTSWQNAFFTGGAPTGPSNLVTGFVRYVTPVAVAVPEPSSVALVVSSLLFAGSGCSAGRRKTHNSK